MKYLIGNKKSFFNVLLNESLIKHISTRRQSTAEYVKKYKKPLRDKAKVTLESHILENRVYGLHPVSLALKARKRKIMQIYHTREFDEQSEILNDIKNDCVKYGIMTSKVATRNEISNYAGPNMVHQGICAITSKYPCPVIGECSEIQSFIYEEQKPFNLALYLDKILDPMNFGAVLRSSYYFGIDKILMGNKKCCPTTSLVSKASSGAMELLEIARIDEFEKSLPLLKENGWQIVGTGFNSPCLHPVHQFKPNKKCILILGNEGKGISEEIKEHLDLTISVESNRPNSAIRSLNVSAATSALLHSLMRNYLT